MNEWIATDGNGPEVQYEAQSSKLAAMLYVDDGDWDDSHTKTTWIQVFIRPAGIEDERSESHWVRLDPPTPFCEDGSRHHEWECPHEIVGGLKENPGVFGHGGGVKIKSVCQRCGLYRITDTWATNPANGEQGLESVEYLQPDDQSVEWVNSLKEADK